MRRVSLLITLLGVIILASLVKFQSPLKIDSETDYSTLKDNQKVSVLGQVIDEKIYSNSRTLFLNTGVTLYCTCNNIGSLKGKNITALGQIDTYQKARINVLSIKW